MDALVDLDGKPSRIGKQRGFMKGIDHNGQDNTTSKLLNIQKIIIMCQ
jgi:hypothetical protein